MHVSWILSLKCLAHQVLLALRTIHFLVIWKFGMDSCHLAYVDLCSQLSLCRICLFCLFQVRLPLTISGCLVEDNQLGFIAVS